MRKTSYNISKKIDPVKKGLLQLVHNTTQDNGLEFLIVGATARDIIINDCYEISIDLRATQDLDIAISVKDWDDSHKLKDDLLQHDEFRETAIEYKLKYMNVFPLDIIPFGQIEDANGKIFFPQSQREMTTLGFKEALANSIKVEIIDSETVTSVASLDCLFIMKLIAWDEKYPDRNRDAYDMDIIIKNYLGGNAETKLFEDNNDLFDDEEFDFEKAGARILGRDIKTSSARSTLDYIRDIIEKELKPESNFRLVRALIGNIIEKDEISKINSIIEEVLKGIND